MRIYFGLSVFIVCSLVYFWISAGGAHGQTAYLVDERPCPDLDPRLRQPRDNEWCDYVTKIKRCDGDLAERLFQQSRAPAYLISELGTEHPRRLICHPNE
ncbi:hypothetical protein [Bradyrhizobium iriomotense]|uniref:hypothetical protein n=1 Tax=Bradyrhizobium iriomotense TaxID=441950 RepID=UPI001B8A0018|nr:hypothetical protein [Bradyrhizobium iriomotense]MBR1126676.1 hypothetical protein [Bradyrhizobium iriomotense]